MAPVESLSSSRFPFERKVRQHPPLASAAQIWGAPSRPDTTHHRALGGTECPLEPRTCPEGCKVRVSPHEPSALGRIQRPVNPTEYWSGGATRRDRKLQRSAIYPQRRWRSDEQVECENERTSEAYCPGSTERRRRSTVCLKYRFPGVRYRHSHGLFAPRTNASTLLRSAVEVWGDRRRAVAKLLLAHSKDFLTVPA